MDQNYNSIVEALIFSSDEPLSAAEIIRAIQGIDGEDIIISTDEIEKCVDNLNAKYQDMNISFKIKRIASGFIHATTEEYAKYIGYLSSERTKRRLSQSALETLSIIAYKQPITKPEIEQIRGVNSDYMLTTLLEKNLILIKGRAETIGRPLLYATTDEFLKYFGLYKLSDLPKPRELSEIMNDEDFLDQKRKIMMNAIEDEIQNEISEDDNDEDQA